MFINLSSTKEKASSIYSFVTSKEESFATRFPPLYHILYSIPQNGEKNKFLRDFSILTPNFMYDTMNLR